MSERRYSRVARFVAEHPWAILPERLDAILDVMELHQGRQLTPEEIQARVGTPPEQPTKRMEGAVAIIPVHGVIAHRMNMMTAMSGGTSTDALTQAIRMAAADDGVKAILLDIDSPGGSVFGLQELADEVFAARGPKPILAVANATAASAAYWIASQADQFLVTPSGMVGSIGVIATHVDRSKQAELLGVKHTFITAGTFKGEVNDVEPLTDPARADMQRKVDQYYNVFVRSVARGRGVPVKDVKGGMGEGRMVTAQDAVALRMVDGISTLDDALGSLLAGRKRVPGMAAEDYLGEVAAFRARIDALVGDLDSDTTDSVEVPST